MKQTRGSEQDIFLFDSNQLCAHLSPGFSNQILKSKKSKSDMKLINRKIRTGSGLPLIRIVYAIWTYMKIFLFSAFSLGGDPRFNKSIDK